MNYNFKNLVFEGGGVKGIAYGGALTELDRLGLLNGIKRVSGTSAGAITATLLALGYTTKEISDIVAATDFSKFEDNTFFVVRDIIRLINKYGWNRGDTFKKWMGELIEAKTGNPDFTLGELHELNKDHSGLKDLFIVCSNITKQRAEVLSYETTPDLSICQAVRMSMSIPIYFAAVTNDVGDIIVDGGVTMNYPIQIFDYQRFIENPDNGMKVNYTSEDDYVFNYETLGFRVDTEKERNYLVPTWPGDPSMTKNLKRYVCALINFTMEMVNRKHLHNNDWSRTVFINSDNIKSTEFKLTRGKINNLLENGKQGVISYFKWRDNDVRWSSYPK